MKKIVIIIFLLSLGCSTKSVINSNKKGINSKQETSIETPRRVPTHNKNLPYPFIHINGFKDFEILTSNIIKDSTSSYASELRFNATYSAFYTKQVMYEKFGLWNKKLRIKREEHPILIWENVNLFNDGNLFTVYATGFENTNGPGNQVKNNSFHKQVKGSNHGIYASVIVLDSSGIDCLKQDNIELRNSIIEFFSDGIKNLSTSNEFYDLYWKEVRRR